MSASEAPWHSSFPAPVSTTVYLPRTEVHKLLLSHSHTAGKDYVLVDLRRNDHVGGTIRGSINLPAQSLYPTLPVLYTLFKSAGVKQVIFYCGSSGGRGSRAASWFQDYLNAEGEKEMKSVALEGGIKGWVGSGEEYVKEILGYDAAAWAPSS
ncbi:Rhodanese-like protein [Ascodesmis nigricans]|uniref:Rhodanese-like protein n=1 Tax=Ascodesmis nigricans TaxID=341454 RepID=A0A4S2MX80_9PEZI|nr:Rhodanese-like protein [Ascodesmis nigricans]